jgi:hypothetical protein
MTAILSTVGKERSLGERTHTGETTTNTHHELKRCLHNPGSWLCMFASILHIDLLLSVSASGLGNLSQRFKR